MANGSVLLCAITSLQTGLHQSQQGPEILHTSCTLWRKDSLYSLQHLPPGRCSMFKCMSRHLRIRQYKPAWHGLWTVNGSKQNWCYKVWKPGQNKEKKNRKGWYLVLLKFAHPNRAVWRWILYFHRNQIRNVRLFTKGECTYTNTEALFLWRTWLHGWATRWAGSSVNDWRPCTFTLHFTCTSFTVR